MDFGQILLNSIIQAFANKGGQQAAPAAAAPVVPPAASAAAPAAAPVAIPQASADTVQGRKPVVDTEWRAQQAGVTPEVMEQRKAEGAAHEAAKRAAMADAIQRVAGGIGASYAPEPPAYQPTVPSLLPKKSTKR